MTRVRVLLMPALLVLLGGCTTTIVPPLSLNDPQPVFVLDHGRHTSLVLPHPEGVVRYAYGDWRWYAKGETGIRAGSSAVLVPSRAGLGRRVLPGPATDKGVRQSVGVAVEYLHSLTVEANRVTALREELDALFRKGEASRTYNAEADLEFVPHPESYSAFSNSNHKVGEWLVRLGCQVRGSRFWASWRLEAPAPAGE